MADYDLTSVADGPALDAAIGLALTSVQPGASPQLATIELGHATDTTLSRLSAGVAGLEGKPLQVVDYADLGDQTNVSLTLTENADTIRSVNLTDDGTLTVTGAGAGKYGAGLLRITSSANGTNVLSPPAGARWADGIARSLAPTTGQTVALYVQSVNNVIVLSVAYDQVPA